MSIQPATWEHFQPGRDDNGARWMFDQLVNQYWDDVKMVNLYPPAVAQAVLDLEGSHLDDLFDPNPSARLETHGTCDNASYIMRACLQERAAGRLIKRTESVANDIRAWSRRVRLVEAD